MVKKILKFSSLLKKGVLVYIAFQKYQQWTEEVEDLVIEALSILYSVCIKPISLTLSEALQGHINLQSIQRLNFVKEVSYLWGKPMHTQQVLNQLFCNRGGGVTTTRLVLGTLSVNKPMLYRLS